jgi:hypothetical protein
MVVLRVISRRLRRLVPAASAFALLASCDPCAGTASCRVPTFFAINGQIVNAVDGRGVNGIRIDAIRVAGVASDRDSLTTTTSDNGFFRFDVGAAGQGGATFDIVVHTPRLDQPYRVPVNVTARNQAGDADVLDRWVADPYFASFLELYWRGSSDERISVPFTFTRTSGAVLTSPTFSTTTDGAGRAQFFQFSTFPRTFEPVVGDLSINLPAPFRPEVQRGVSVAPTHLYRPPPGIIRRPAGPALSYFVEVYDRRTIRRVPGVRMTFHRVSGAQVEPNDFERVSGDGGRLYINPRPLESGEVVADITLVPPPPGGPQRFRATFPTFDADETRMFSTWGVQPHMPYFAILSGGGRTLPGVTVEIRRTGGIALDSSFIVRTTDAEGNFIINPQPQAVGDAIVELTVRAPAPFRPFLVRNLRLPTIDENGPIGRLLWIWDLSKPLTAPPGADIVLLPPAG